VKAGSGMMLTLLLKGILPFNIQVSKGEPTTWTVDDNESANFSLTQETIMRAYKKW